MGMDKRPMKRTSSLRKRMKAVNTRQDLEVIEKETGIVTDIVTEGTGIETATEIETGIERSVQEGLGLSPENEGDEAEVKMKRGIVRILVFRKTLMSLT